MTITIADGRGALWQWDTGRRVKITDGDGVKQVHYQNKYFGRSVDVDVGTDGTAIIPDELLQDWHPLMAYAYVTDDAGGYTKVQVDFAVHKRAKPAGYVYTPAEQLTLQTIQRQIGDLAALTTTAKDTLVAAINEAAKSGGSESMELRVSDGYIQYSTDGGLTWQSLIAVAELKGAKGDKGDPGPRGAPGAKGDSYTLTTADKSEIADAVVADGVQAELGDGPVHLGITGATPGQIAKITAVDAQGKPTAWEPVEMASGGGELTWHEVIDYETTAEINDLRISTDKSGRAISGYHAIEMVLNIEIPADSTQASTNGSIWIYPFSDDELSSRLRLIENVAGWKTTLRRFNYFYAGSSRAMFVSAAHGASADESLSTVLDGVRLYVNNKSDHLPVGTKVRCLVLSKGWEA